MPVAPKPTRFTARRSLTLLFWLSLWSLAAIGVFFLALLVAGAIQFAVLDCGPRSNWSEQTYTACSDIDETNPIFFLIGFPAILPLLAALLIRAVIRGTRAF